MSRKGARSLKKKGAIRASLEPQESGVAAPAEVSGCSRQRKARGCAGCAAKTWGQLRASSRFLPQCHGGDVHDAFLAAGEATRDRLFRRALVDSDEAAKSVVMRVNAEAAAGYTDAYYQAAITATRSSPGRGS
jgi:hypothetical protein